jgi:hypothetical protein
VIGDRRPVERVTLPNNGADAYRQPNKPNNEDRLSIV